MKEQYEEINRTIKEEIRKKGFLIAAHRGHAHGYISGKHYKCV